MDSGEVCEVEWTVVSTKKPPLTSAKSADRRHATATNNQLRPNAPLTTRRNSQPNAHQLQTPPNNSRRSSLTVPSQSGSLQGGEEFASFRKGHATSKTQNKADWRRGSASNEPPSPGEVAQLEKKKSLPRMPSKKSPKAGGTPKLSKPASRGKSPTRSPSPLQPHAPIHQVGHSRFSLGPIDFPNLVFRRVIWAAEKAARAAGADSPRSDSQADSPVLAPSGIVVDEVVQELALDFAHVADPEPMTMPASALPEPAAPAVVVAPAASVDESSAPTSTVDTQSTVPQITIVEPNAHEASVDVAPIAVVTPSSAKKKKKQKKSSPASPTAKEEPVVVAQAEPLIPVNPVIVPAVATPAATLSAAAPSSNVPNQRQFALQVSCGLVGFLVLLSILLPSSRFLALPLATLILVAVAAVHHPGLQAKLPESLRVESLPQMTASAAKTDHKHEFTKDKLALLSRVTPPHSKKKANKSRR